MTLPEILLWKRLQKRQTGYLFNRQFGIGQYITDFCCRKHKLIVEVDGKVHLSNRDKDEMRDACLAQEGYFVLRFSAQSVLRDPDFIASQIKEYLDNLARQEELE